MNTGHWDLFPSYSIEGREYKVLCRMTFLGGKGYIDSILSVYEWN